MASIVRTHIMGTYQPKVYYGKVSTARGIFTVIRTGEDEYRWGPITADSPPVDATQLMQVFDTDTVPNLTITTHQYVWGY
jgi:hypothetical protein